MTQVLIDRATLEQLVRALKQIQALTDGRDIYLGSPPTESKERKILTLATECRAALANAEPAGWQTLVDHGKEAHELAKIMKDFADKNPESLMLKELDN